MTPPPPVDTDVSKEKKGKKGKGRKKFSPESSTGCCRELELRKVLSRI
jgi:hypothetical protein